MKFQIPIPNSQLPIKERIIALAVFLGCLILPGCGALEKLAKAKGLDKELKVVQSAASAFLPMGVDEEIEIGRAMSARIIQSSGGLYQDEPLTIYVNLVGRTVARQAKRTDLPDSFYQFGILNSDEINAFALPGGYILITKGTLKLVENEAELAGVLGHEIAHVDEAHLAKAIKTAHGAQFVNDLTAVYQKNDNAGINRFLASSSETGLTTLYQRGLSRENEADADTHAVKYIAAVGYDPAAYLRFLTRLQSLETQQAGLLKTLQATHPPVTERMQVVQNALAKSGAAGGKELAERYQKISQLQ